MSERTEAERVALRRLSMDAFTVRAVAGLRAAGVRAILLKGISHARWLYDPGEPARASIDVDLLVAPADHERAAGVLAALGMRPHRTPPLPPESHADAWLPGAPGQCSIDLHDRFHFIADGERLWHAVVADTEVLRIGDHEIEVPSEPLRALLAMLHVAAAAVSQPRTVEEAGRVVARLHRETWLDVRGLADELGVREPLAAALWMTEGGDAVARALELARPDSAAWRLRRDPGFSEGDLRMLDAADRRGLRTLLRRELFPDPERMRIYYRLARRGRTGLALAYLARLARLSLEIPGLTRRWARARREQAVPAAAPRDLRG